MSNPSAAGPQYYEATLLPALLEIQRRYGYLEEGALRKHSERSGVPLHRLQAVGSFFPHFRLAPHAKVAVRVCRDMACHMAGSADIMAKLSALDGKQVTITGASCLGRCDRAPATCAAIEGHEHEFYYLARSADQLRTIIEACLAG